MPKSGVRPDETAVAEPARAELLPDRALPVVWLLGKTGAGKSSLIRALLDDESAEIGNGFQPCTRDARRYDHPPRQPLIRFLDTRGLGEAAYDPTEDIAALQGHAHVLLLVCRIDDPVQGEIAETWARVLKAQPEIQTILVLTGADLLPDATARDRAAAGIAGQMRAMSRRPFRTAIVTLAPGTAREDSGIDALIDLLLDTLPAVGLYLSKPSRSDAEAAAFQEVRKRVLYYAGLAGSSDSLPLVGWVSVPGTQGLMLRELAGRYDIEWNRKTMASFAGALGLGFGARYLASLGARQMAKLIPVVGQIAGGMAAASISFASTYALGRAASYYLFHTGRGAPPSSEDLRAIYASAFKRSADAAPR